MVYNLFNETISVGPVTLANKSAIISNKKVVRELHKQIIRNFNKNKVQSLFIDGIWVANLADMPLISTFNKGFRFLLCVIDIYNKNAQVIPLKVKKRN